MKLLTLNCHSWQEDNQFEKIKYIASVIKEGNYDVIALQEVSQLANEKTIYDNIKKDNFAFLIKKELEKIGINDYGFFWDMSHIGYDIYEEGLCIMTKLPIKESESFFISNSKNLNYWKTRKIIKIKVLYNNHYINFYSCHLGWFNDEEEPFINQFDNLKNHIEKEELTFIMGDFNNSATVRDEGYDYIIENEFLDTYNLAKFKDEGTTVEGNIAGWDKNKEDLRLDMIFSSKEIEVLYSNVIFNGKNKDIVSDHFGVEIEINI
ncbi:MAG: endonuclease/exonuclease/phosphatase family protein [Romboutsia sp.]|uniref:endonuclease/exonuclease/phosphatase family protein n=1 Tax=Romboutsia sp. TaxID=1965302 RepID=UPI003F3FD9F4